VSKFYPYTRQHAYRYRFFSDGKERIEKIALFDSTPVDNLYNFAFGDLLKDGTINIYANSNNGDVIKVFATVIQIVKLFTNENPSATVFFTGVPPDAQPYINEFSKIIMIQSPTNSSSMP